MMQELIDRFNSHVDNGHAECLTSAAMDILGPFGIEHIFYFSLGRFKEAETPEIETNYSCGWFDHHQCRVPTHMDPTPITPNKSFETIDWRSADHLSFVLPNHVGEARTSENRHRTMTIPISDDEGRCAVFMVRTIDVNDEKMISIDRLPDIIYNFAILYHQYMKRTNPIVMNYRPRLSKRERQVLGWAAAGKSAWETSIILGLSQRTIDSYMRNCVQKLGAANKTQAVAVAVSYALLEPHIFRQGLI